MSLTMQNYLSSKKFNTKKMKNQIYTHNSSISIIPFKLNTIFLLSAIIFILYTPNANRRFGDSQKTEVLVVGTIHQLHSKDTNYTFQDVVNILNTYNPDVVCVEIRPQEFRKELYLPEMTLATIWAVANDKNVYPIDWWQNDTRHLQDSLMKLPEYIQKEKEVDSIAATDSILTGFEKKYGTWQEQILMGYDFWNGKEYNDYTMENYRLWTDAFGESPVTLFYKTRNDSMMALIQNVIRENPGKKIIVLTGSEHKHYFDNSLKNNPDVSLIEFGSILPLENKEQGPVIESYFNEGNDLLYFEKGFPENVNDYYRAKLIPILHGNNMDIQPEVVPEENIKLAEKIIGRWKNDTASASAADVIDFELGWIKFLKQDYRSAIENLFPLSKRIESGSVKDAFIMAATHRNLGFCYDCLRERDSAIACYTKGEELIRGTALERAKEFLFKDYKTNPYIWKKD